MSRLTIAVVLGLMFSLQALAQDASLTGFNNRFAFQKNEEGKITAIRLKKVVRSFSIMPFLEQIKADLTAEQNSFKALNDAEKEAEIDQMLYEMGLDPYAKDGNGAEEARRMKESLMNLKNIDLNAAFAKLKTTDFWKEFERKLQEAFLFIDPTVLANLEDARFFYKRQVTYQVVMWALEQAPKVFGDIPVLNMATFVIVRIHDMMLEQRHFHHNMFLHYVETIPETKLGMTKEEVDRAVSSIYEYRIQLTNLPESNRAARDWLNYGMNSFYMMVRSGNSRIQSWKAPLSNSRFSDIKKINYGFAEVMEEGNKKIYHLHINGHQFSQKAALAFDYSDPKRVQRNRALMNFAGIALGFVPNIPEWIKGNVQTFLQSMYVQQVRMEGALVGYFESTGDQAMTKKIYRQRNNFYIVE